MFDIDLTFVWTAVNLIILYLFLRKFLFGRITAFMDARAEEVANNIAQAERDKAAAEETRRQTDALQKELAARQADILAEARKRGDAQYDLLVAQARAEARRILDSAKEGAQREHERVISQVHDEVASLALAAAGKVLQANMDTQANRDLVTQLLDDMNEEIA